QWLLVNRAQSVAQFKRALSSLQIPSLDAVCVDSKGNVFYAYCAKGQYKLETVDWQRPVDGSRFKNEWRGFMPFTAMPQATNPPAGFVQSANGPPWRVAGDASPKLTDYPRYLVEDTPSFRSDRILDVVNNKKPISIKQIQKLAWDVTIPFAESAIRMLTAAGQTDWRRYEDPQGQMRYALNMLQKWDRRVAADSSCAVLFDTWWRQYRRVLNKPLSDADIIAAFDKPGPRESETALKALRLSIDILTARFGKIDVKWGDVHRMKAARIDLPAQGTADLHTIHQADPVDGQKRPGVTVVGRGDTFKMVVQLGPNVPSVISIMPGGNSTDPKSPHLTDQMNLYSNGQFKRIDLDRSTAGIGMVSAWGTTSKLVAAGIGTTLHATSEKPVSVEMKPLSAGSIAPPMPRTAKLVGTPVRVSCTPRDAKTQWTLSVAIPSKLRGLLDMDFTPIGLIETIPGRWRPVPATVTADKSRIIIRSGGYGTVAIYLVVKKTN
ncbi:MAG: penicillin acylase family protein, partial [Candidatus Hydrogenedentes bacterium]|nr:penicillin acylase family protein [Candidatus Hydrogenedentota bacterium]